jgi:hypothetical protein
MGDHVGLKDILRECSLAPSWLSILSMSFCHNTANVRTEREGPSNEILRIDFMVT